MDEKKISKLINFTNLYSYRNRDYKVITLARTRLTEKNDFDTINVVVAPVDMPYVSYVYEWRFFVENFADTETKFYA